MKLIGVALMAAACGSGESEKPATAPAPAAIAKSIPTISVDAGPAIDAPPNTLELPKRRIAAADLFGRTPAQVDKMLGKADGDYRDVEGAVFRVEFDENDKSAYVAITADRQKPTTIEEQYAVLEWLGLDHASATWDFDELMSEVEVWRDAETRKRSEERHRIAIALGDFMKRVNYGGGHARQDLNKTFLVRPNYGKPCNKATLAKLRAELEEGIEIDFATLGFRKMQCNIDGPSIAIR